MTKMYWIELDQTDGNMMPFPSEDAYELACEWYNAKTKRHIITYCQHRNVSLDDPTDTSAPQKKLWAGTLSCWADLAMATYAWQQADPKMVSVVGLIAREVADQ